MAVVLQKGPINLPALHYFTLRKNGPFSSPSTPNRKAVVTVVWDNFTTAAPAAHLSAIVTTDGGTTWVEVAGPAVYCQPGSGDGTMFPLPERAGEDVFIFHTLTIGNYALLKFNLLTFAWTTLNAAIATWPAGQLNSVWTPNILVNDTGYGLASILTATTYPGIFGQSILRFKTDGTALGIERFVETDPGFFAYTLSQISDPNYFAGVALDNTFTTSVLEFDPGAGAFRVRTIHWAADTSTHSLSVAVPTFPISTSPSTSVLVQINDAFGNTIKIEFLAIDGAANQPTNENSIPGGVTGGDFATREWSHGLQVGSCIFVVYTAIHASGLNELKIVERDQTNTWQAPQLIASNVDPVGPIQLMSTAEITGTTVDVITTNLDTYVIPAGEYRWVPLWYWQLTTPACSPPTPACPVLNTLQVGVFYSQALTAGGGTGPYTWALLSPLPAGLTLDPLTGIISGYPAAPLPVGAFCFDVEVTDSLGATATIHCCFNVIAPCADVSQLTEPAVAGYAGSAAPSIPGQTQSLRSQL